MTYHMIILVILAAVSAIMGILILLGKGDYLIAGYNLASKEEREQYHVKRLRGLTGGVLIALVPLLFLLAGEPSIGKMITFSTLVFVLCILVVVLANTWAKKKSK